MLMRLLNFYCWLIYIWAMIWINHAETLNRVKIILSSQAKKAKTSTIILIILNRVISFSFLYPLFWLLAVCVCIFKYIFLLMHVNIFSVAERNNPQLLIWMFFNNLMCLKFTQCVTILWHWVFCLGTMFTISDIRCTFNLQCVIYLQCLCCYHETSRKPIRFQVVVVLVNVCIGLNCKENFQFM